MARVYNFSAGPSTLPVEILEETQKELVDFDGQGMSLLEMSHRGKQYEAVHGEVLALARELVDLPDDFEVLLLQGGATLQFTMVPANLLGERRAGAYAVTGSWAKKALADARHYGDAYAAWEAPEPAVLRTPRDEELSLRPDTRYLHITSNETIEGIRYPDWPDVDVPLVADMSSDFLSRPIEWSRFDLAYGGAQKNLGPAGVALVYVRRRVLAQAPNALGAYLRYAVHADKDSLYNTPAVFAVWMMGKVLRWLRDHGGVRAMAEAAQRKSAALYTVIDESDGFYDCPAEPRCRSHMNVVFRLPDDELQERFLAEAAAAELVNLKGHRSVGGCRASLYNAMPQEGADRLAELMRDFAKRAG
ncbi:MAG: 3-phosphoserine/phosphohydroxythreonine transaminase [Egibacteraceae bacterium]